MDRSLIAPVPATTRLSPLRWFVALLLGATLAAGSASAEDPLLLASTLWSSAQAVRTCDEVAIVLFSGGLATFDVSNPSAPALIERFDRCAEFWGWTCMEVAGGLVYAASAEGLQVYDFSDPTQPMQVGLCDEFSGGYDIRIEGHLAYIAGGYEGGLGIVDITDPAAPALLGRCHTPGGCFALALGPAGEYAYVADGMSGIAIVDVGDPLQPQHVSSIYNVVYPPFDIDAVDGYVYAIGCEGGKRAADPAGRRRVAGDSEWDPSGMSIHDISNPLEPEFRGRYDSDQGTNALSVRGGLAHIANANGTYSIVDVGNPVSPVLLSEIVTAGYATDLHLVSDRAYIAASRGCLLVLDVGAPTAPILVGRWWEANGSNHVSACNGLVCVADRNYGLHLVDASDPHGPIVASRVELPAGSWAVVTDGAYAYAAADADGIYVFDVSDPQAPALVAHVEISSIGLDFDGRYLYAVGWDEELWVVDVLDPLHPALLGSLTLPGPSWSISVQGGLGCLTTGGELCLVDLEDPCQPALRGIYDPDPYVHRVSFDGTYAYVSGGNDGLYVIDASDPELPVHVTELHFNGNTRGSCLAGDRLYLGANGLQVIDVSDPTNPQVVGSAYTRSTLHVCTFADLAFTADGGSLGIFRIGQLARGPEPGEAQAALGPELVSPSPVRGSAHVRLRLGREAHLSLELLDVRGRRVLHIHSGSVSTGESRFPWNTTGVPVGRYFLCARTPYARTIQPVVIVR